VFDIIGKRKWFYGLSLAVTVPGLIFILLTLMPGSHMGLQFSIDYTGGTEWEIHFANGLPTSEAVQQVLTDQGLTGTITVTKSPDGRQFILIKTEPIGLRDVDAPCATPAPSASVSPSASPLASGSPDAGASAGPSTSPGPTPSPQPTPSPSPSASPSPAVSPAGTPAASLPPCPAATPAPSAAAGAVGASPGASVPPSAAQASGKLAELKTALETKFGPIDDVLIETNVGPVVSAELVQQAIILILFGTLGIMIWITFRFGDFRMGVTAIVALIHDVIVVVGIFAILGTVVGLQLDALFVTAMLTVIGFSVHDTIVVFDRIRENRVRHAGEAFEQIVNHSILQTVGRSINTSMTVVITLSALFLFGGQAIHAFVLALLIGIVSGTYSSIFNASPLLVDWHRWSDRRKQAEAAATRAGQARAT